MYGFIFDDMYGACRPELDMHNLIYCMGCFAAIGSVRYARALLNRVPANQAIIGALNK